MAEKIKSCNTCRYAKQNYVSVIGVIPWCCEKHWHCKPGSIASDYMPKKEEDKSRCLLWRAKGGETNQ